VLPARCLPQGGRPPGGGSVTGAALGTPAGADPPFQGGFSGRGDLALASNAICHYKSPSRPRACRWAQRRGIRPYAAGLKAPGEGACRRRIRGSLASVIGPRWKIPDGEIDKKPAPPREIVALKETLGRGLIRNQHVWISPNNGFPVGLLLVSRHWRYGRGEVSVASNGLVVHR
jgi:hypothetical protein